MMNTADLANAPTVRLTRKSKADVIKSRSSMTRLTWWHAEMNLPKHNAQKSRRNCGVPIEAPTWADAALMIAGWN